VAAGSGSKKAGGGGDQAEAARMQAAIAGQTFGQTQPLRSAIFGQPALTFPEQQRVQELRGLLGTQGPSALNEDDFRMLREMETRQAQPVSGILPDFLRTGALPAAVAPLTVPVRETLEAQFGRARENILARTPARGGQLADVLAGLETDRATRVGLFQSEMEAPIRQNLLQIASNAVLGAPTQALMGFQGAGAQFGQIAQQAALQQQATGEALGSSAALLSQLALMGAFGGRGGSGAPFAGQGNQPLLL